MAEIFLTTKYFYLLSVTFYSDLFPIWLFPSIQKWNVLFPAIYPVDRAVIVDVNAFEHLFPFLFLGRVKEGEQLFFVFASYFDPRETEFFKLSKVQPAILILITAVKLRLHQGFIIFYGHVSILLFGPFGLVCVVVAEPAAQIARV